MEYTEENTFECTESERQELTFGFLKGLEERKGNKLDTRACILRTDDGKYNNLALMLSDECPWTCEIRRDGTVDSIIGGSLLKQLDASMKAALAAHKESSSAAGRCSKISLALSEVILNAITHRRYDCETPTIIDVGQNWIEVFSPGKPVVRRLSYNSRTRNPMLAKAFDNMGFKNSSIIGMDGVINSYRSC